jgi:hypothetical protein
MSSETNNVMLDQIGMAMELAETAEKTLQQGDAIQALVLLSAIPAFLPENQRINMGALLCDAVRGNLNYGDAIKNTIRIIVSVREGDKFPPNHPTNETA